MLPMAPEFVRFLEELSINRHHGYSPIRHQLQGSDHHRHWWVSKMICRIGKAAKVKVDVKTKTGTDGKPVEVVKYASAHDLRRSFGERWARKVVPQVLMELMRHESIDTTMRYYVGRNAQSDECSSLGNLRDLKIVTRIVTYN